MKMNKHFSKCSIKKTKKKTKNFYFISYFGGQFECGISLNKLIHKINKKNIGHRSIIMILSLSLSHSSESIKNSFFHSKNSS